VSREHKTIPVCSCATPDPADPVDLILPLCYGCGRLVVPEKHAAMKRVEVRARDGHAYPCEHCGDSLLSGSHGQGVCVGPAVPLTFPWHEPGKAQREAGIKGESK
jgi:hypothetical protein